VIWIVLALILTAIVVTLAARARPAMERARHLADGTQDARVVVDRGYVPSCIGLEAGVPAMLRFDRREADPCTELLVSELWPNAHRLVAHGETAIRFTPQRPGHFVFTCGMGMYSGELVVHEGSKI
jgi:plastocyanin domain-containing protein